MRKSEKIMRYLAHRYPAKKEAKRLEKEAKLAAKAAKAVATTPAGEKKAKEKAVKEEVAPFVNTTPKGQKKGEFIRRRVLAPSLSLGLSCNGLRMSWNRCPSRANLIHQIL